MAGKLYPDTALLLLEHKDFSNKKNKKLYLNNFAEHEIFDIMTNPSENTKKRLAQFIEKCKNKDIKTIKIELSGHGVLIKSKKTGQQLYNLNKLIINSNLLYIVLSEINKNCQDKQIIITCSSCYGPKKIDVIQKNNEKISKNLRSLIKELLKNVPNITYQIVTRPWEIESCFIDSKGRKKYNILSRFKDGKTIEKRTISEIENQYKLQDGKWNSLSNCGVLTKPTIDEMKKDTTTKINKKTLPQNASSKSKKEPLDTVKTTNIKPTIRKKEPMDTMKPKTEYRKIKNKEPQDSKRKQPKPTAQSI